LEGCFLANSEVVDASGNDAEQRNWKRREMSLRKSKMR
jgi:hypothetical protein